jgi:hypothetical protein
MAVVGVHQDPVAVPSPEAGDTGASARIRAAPAAVNAAATGPRRLDPAARSAMWWFSGSSP